MALPFMTSTATPSSARTSWTRSAIPSPSTSPDARPSRRSAGTAVTTVPARSPVAAAARYSTIHAVDAGGRLACLGGDGKDGQVASSVARVIARAGRDPRHVAEEAPGQALGEVAVPAHAVDGVALVELPAVEMGRADPGARSVARQEEPVPLAEAHPPRCRDGGRVGGDGRAPRVVDLVDRRVPDVVAATGGVSAAAPVDGVVPGELLDSHGADAQGGLGHGRAPLGGHDLLDVCSEGHRHGALRRGSVDPDRRGRDEGAGPPRALRRSGLGGHRAGERESPEGDRQRRRSPR